jgi:hypothetical protein
MADITSTPACAKKARTAFHKESAGRSARFAGIVPRTEPGFVAALTRIARKNACTCIHYCCKFRPDFRTDWVCAENPIICAFLYCCLSSCFTWILQLLYAVFTQQSITNIMKFFFVS